MQIFLAQPIDYHMASQADLDRLKQTTDSQAAGLQLIGFPKLADHAQKLNNIDPQGVALFDQAVATWFSKNATFNIRQATGGT